MAKSAETILNKWINGAAQAANGAYKEGIQSVTVSPTQKAAASVDRYASGCARAASDGSFVNGCNKVTLQDWQQAASTKGVANYSRGVSDAREKMRRHIQSSMPFWAQVSEMAKQMPKGDLEQGIAKVRAVCQAMKTQYGKM